MSSRRLSVAFAAIVVFCTLLFAGPRAFAYTPPPNDGPITDPAGKLSPEDKQALSDKILAYKTQTGNGIAYFIAPSLNGEDIEDVGFATAQAWGIGAKKLDRGVLVTMAPNERKIRIDVGKGAEGELTDLQSSQIIQQIIGPRLKQNDFRGAIDQSFVAIVAALNDPTHGGAAASGGGTSLGSVIFIVIIMLLIIFFLARRGGGGGGGSRVFLVRRWRWGRRIWRRRWRGRRQLWWRRKLRRRWRERRLLSASIRNRLRSKLDLAIASRNSARRTRLPTMDRD